MPPNRALIFVSEPTGWPVEGENLKVSSLPDFSLSTEPPPPASSSDGGITTRNHYFSYDPYQRGRLRSPDIKSYAQPYSIGEPITNAGIASVILSKNSGFAPGDVVISPYLRFEEYGIYTGSEIQTLKFRKLLNPYHLDPKIFLGALGMTGLSAYSSLYAIGQPVRGETILVSAASGAVGQVVGQLAKREGLKVIGSVGSDEKVKFITEELDFDAGFNYKKEQPGEALKRLAPAGVDIYYDNVGGEMLDAALEAMNPWGRIGECSSIVFSFFFSFFNIFSRLFCLFSPLLSIPFCRGPLAPVPPLYLPKAKGLLIKFGWVGKGGFFVLLTYVEEREADRRDIILKLNSSRLRDDISIQPLVRLRRIRRQESLPHDFQTDQIPRLHRRGRKHGPQIYRRTSREFGQVDPRRHF